MQERKKCITYFTILLGPPCQVLILSMEHKVRKEAKKRNHQFQWRMNHTNQEKEKKGEHVVSNFHVPESELLLLSRFSHVQLCVTA